MRTRRIRDALAAGVLFAVLCGVLIAILGGVTVKLACARAGPSEPVNCIKQTSLYWTVPLGEQNYRDVRGATVYEDRGHSLEYPTTFDMHLLTDQGEVPLTFASGQRAPPNQRVDRINTFVRTSTEKSLEITDPGWLLSGGYWCLVCLLPFYFSIYFASWMSEKSKPASG